MLRNAGIVTLILVASTNPAEATSPPNVVVNIHYAEDLGCSDDPWEFLQPWGADLQLRLWQRDALLFESRKIQDDDHAEWYDYATTFVPGSPATFAIELGEAENVTPYWVPCDIDPGEGNWLNVTIGAEGALINTTGNAMNAAHLVAKFGYMDEPRPGSAEIEVLHRTPDSMTLSWYCSASPIIEKQTLRGEGIGKQDVPINETNVTIRGLQSDKHYSFVVALQGNGWFIDGPRRTERTLDENETIRPAALPSCLRRPSIAESAYLWGPLVVVVGILTAFVLTRRK